VVHGGTRLTASCWLDRDAEREIERLAPLAPLHNPHALAWIAACRAQFGRAVPQAAMFDTAFFASLPRFASTYALPAALTGHGELRRFGFHGLAHQSMLAAWGQGQGRLITVQLGSGCSIAAIRDSQAVDTSMGFTPLEGLVMSTRSGDVDPGLLLHLQVAGGHSAERLAEVLSHQSGLLGLSSRSSDMRALLAADDPASALAIEIYCYRVRKYIGAYLAALNGADAILFGGGVGENAPAIRERILSDLDGHRRYRRAYQRPAQPGCRGSRGGRRRGDHAARGHGPACRPGSRR
jgi:acetate kinase